MTTFKKWTEFTSGTAITDADTAVGLQSSANVKWLWSAVKAYVLGATQTANTVLAGPTTGSAAAPAFRALVAADIPALPASAVTLGVGSSAVSGGTTTRILYDNAGALGEYTISGSGTAVAMAAGASLTGATVAGATVTGATITTSDINSTIIGGSSRAAAAFTAALANYVVVDGNTVPFNGMYLPASSTLGWAVGLTAKLQLSSSALTALSGTAVALEGSSNGAVTIQTQAAAGTWNFNLPVDAGSSGYALISAGGGSSPTTWSGFVQQGTGAVTRTWQAKDRDTFNVNDFGGTAAGSINLAIAAALSAGVGTVVLPAGTYTVASSVLMKTGVRLLGEPGAIITQANSANLTCLVDFTGAATHSYLENVTVDGNWANNTTSSSVVLVHIRSASYSGVVNCIVKNSAGYAIATNGVASTITGNEIYNFGDYAVYLANAAPGETAFHKVTGNTVYNIGSGFLIAGNCDYSTLSQNKINGTCIGGRGDRVNVSTSGSTVTWVSGTTFTSLRPGNFVVLNGGAEYRITAVNSSTTLTVTPSPGSLGSQEAILGPGDLFALVGCSYCIASGNNILGSATFGLGLSLAGSAGQTGNNIICDNIITYSGKNGINISYDSGAGILSGNLFHNNRLFNSGNGGTTAIGAADRVAIYIGSGSTGKVVQTYLANNFIESATGAGQLLYWVSNDGNVTTGAILIDGVSYTGTANSGEGGTIAAYSYLSICETPAAVAASWKGDSGDPAIVNGTATYKAGRDGKYIWFSADITMGSSTTFGTGNWYFTLPAPYSANAVAFTAGSVARLDSGTAYFAGTCYIDSGTNKIYMIGYNAGSQDNSANPFTWATGDQLRLSIRYPTG